MAMNLAEYDCPQHGGLEHAYVHAAGLAVSSHAAAMTYENVSVASLGEWATSVESGGLGGIEFGSDSRWGHATTVHHAKLALAFTLAGSVAEHVVYGHSTPHVQSRELLAWYHSLGHTDDLPIDRVEELAGTSLRGALEGVMVFVQDRRSMVDAVARALREAPQHRLSSSEVTLVAAQEL